MAKRKAAPARAGQRQLFPEALQHQRQLTMSVLVPAETARVLAAEQARRDRAKKPNPKRRTAKRGILRAIKKQVCACTNPKARRKPPKRRNAVAGKPVVRLELSRAETSKWTTRPSYRLAVIRKAKSLAKKHRGAVQILDVSKTVRSTIRP